MLLWVVTLSLLPVIAVPLYVLIGERRVRRRGLKKRKRAAPIIRALASVTRADGVTEEQHESQRVVAAAGMEESLKKLAQISNKFGYFPVTGGNKVEVFTTAQEIYDSIIAAIDGARDHIHLEYYIFRPDDTGRQVLDHLVEKAKRGVEVRLLLDGVGSWGTRNSFLRPLVKAGGRVDTFLPAIPLRRPWHLNCRNHRKVVVVDGQIGFTGSQNIGDEYRGLLRPLGPWKDTHLRLEGPAVRELQGVFVEDWYFASKEDLVSQKYVKRVPPAGDSLVQIVATGPDQTTSILSHIFFAALALARKNVRISTPYFVPDPALIVSLQHAAYRGIEVEILIPAKTDNRVVLWAGRSFYDDLLVAGVKIHEFDHGMLHSKWVSIDDHWTLISSANVDIRSFLWNFEVTASVFDHRIAHTLLEDFRADVARSRSIARRSSKDIRIWPQVLEGAARLFAPLL